MSNYNQTEVGGNYNSVPSPKQFTRAAMPPASFDESADGGNNQLATGLRVVRMISLATLTPLVGESAAEAGAVAAEHAFASSFASARCNFRSNFGAPGVYETNHPGMRPLALGGGYSAAFIAAYRELASSAGDPMSTGRAAVCATNEARHVVDASLVAVEAMTSAAVAGARAALSAKAGK